MTEKGNLEKITDDIKDSINSLKEEIQKEGGLWNYILKKLGLKRDQEVQEVETETKKKLDDLSKKLIDIEFNKLEDKEINIEGDLDKLDDETTILGLLAKNNENLKSWFEWLKDVDDEDTRSWEIETVLFRLKEISDDDKNTKGDLTENELKEVGENINNKMKKCENVLKSDDVKDLPDDKKTKKSILDAYNTVLSEKNGKDSEVTEERIIKKLKGIEESDG